MKIECWLQNIVFLGIIHENTVFALNTAFGQHPGIMTPR